MEVWTVGGDVQTAATLDLMAALARKEARDPAIVATAVDLVRWIYPQDPAAEWRAIRRYLSRRVLYIDDPASEPGAEVIRAPSWLLSEIAHHSIARGDCDDVATLGAALALALGMRVRFVVVAFGPDGTYTHVYAELWTPDGWRDLDVHRPPGASLTPTRAAALEV